VLRNLEGVPAKTVKAGWQIEDHRNGPVVSHGALTGTLDGSMIFGRGGVTP
jgi:hypothetical protein